MHRGFPRPADTLAFRVSNTPSPRVVALLLSLPLALVSCTSDETNETGQRHTESALALQLGLLSAEDALKASTQFHGASDLRVG